MRAVQAGTGPGFSTAMATAAAAVTLALPAGAGGQVVAERIAPSAAQSATDYWTPARMRAARPPLTEVGGRVVQRVPAAATPAAAGERAAVDVSGTPTGFPDRVHGKVFFTITGGSSPGDFVCSGTVVRSNSHTLVWTAGHCVNDAEFGGGFASNWAFVPGYRAGKRPFGTWGARTLFTTEGWRRFEDIRNDLGAAELARDDQGRGIEDVIGARGIAFDRPREQQFAAFGYPALASLFHPEFGGQRLYRCNSPTTGSDNPPGNGAETLEIECDMTGGASGGGWVTPAGEVNSVTSYSYATDPFHLYGPYMDETARELFDRASGPPLLCAERAVTNLGNGEPNVFVGTGADDAFVLGGAADRAAGQAGSDAACGAGGRDRLRGGAGNDLLRGGSGRDRLYGGPGFDRCEGGAGRDRAKGCEKRVRIP